METAWRAKGHMYEKEIIIYQFYLINILMMITMMMKMTMAMMIIIIFKARYPITRRKKTEINKNSSFY